MSVADQVKELEDDLAFYKGSAEDLAKEVDKLEQELALTKAFNEELGAFAVYVDKTHPELRVAFEAAEKLKGERR